MEARGLHLASFQPNCRPMSEVPARRSRRIVWQNVLTVASAAILISAEVFGAAFAGSWAIANLIGLGTLGARILDVAFMLCGVAVMVQFLRAANRVEPFTAD
jgi:hypothetical protein